MQYGYIVNPVARGWHSEFASKNWIRLAMDVGAEVIAPDQDVGLENEDSLRELALHASQSRLEICPSWRGDRLAWGGVGTDVPGCCGGAWVVGMRARGK